MDLILGNLVGLFIGGLLAFVYLQATATAGRLERKIDLLIKHSGIDVEKVALEEATNLMKAGKKIEAIKVYRDYTCCSLADAKAKVESMAGA